MSDELERLVRALEADAQKLASPDLDPAQASKLAESMASNAGEAVRLLESLVRDPGPRPDPPGQGSLDVDRMDGDSPLEPLS